MEIKEEWKTIENYPEYMVSNLGRVKSLGNDKTKKEKILKQEITKNGYYRVDLHNGGKGKKKYVHQLVTQTFLPNPYNLPCVNHKDENKQNNCVSNLEWCSYSYNNNYGTRNERMINTKKGEPNIVNSIAIVQIHQSGLIIGVYDSATQVERELNIYHSNITKCCRGELKSCGGYKWKYLDELKKVG